MPLTGQIYFYVVMELDRVVVQKNFNLISFQKLHNQLGHPGYKKLRMNSQENGMNILLNINVDKFQI